MVSKVSNMVDGKRQLNVRISEELYLKIENEDRSKQDIISDALLLYFDSKVHQDLAKDLEHEREKTRLLEANIRDSTASRLSNSGSRQDIRPVGEVADAIKRRARQKRLVAVLKVKCSCKE